MITEAHLYQFVTDEEIFHYYLPQFKRVSAKFRIDENDDDPSAGIFKADNGTLLYKNFVTGECVAAINYVMCRLGLKYNKAIQKIAYDLNVPNVVEVRINDIPAKVQVENKIENVCERKQNLKVKRRPFNKAELDYWKTYDIDAALLKLYKVTALQIYWWCDVQYVPKEMCFCYHFPEDDLYSYKLYFPINKHFISSTSANAVQGYLQLDRSQRLCVITKSLKDVMFLRSLGINAVAPQSESCHIPTKIMEDLRDNFDCFIWYDNDIPGRKGALRIAKQFGFNRDRIILISQHLRKQGVKDPTDMRKIKGREFTLEYITKLKTLYATKFQREEGDRKQTEIPQQENLLRCD